MSTTTTTKKVRLAAAVVAVGALGAGGLSACSQVEPKLAFANAYGSTIGQQDLTTTMSLRTTKQDIQKLYDVFDEQSSSPASGQAKQARDIFAGLLPKLSITSKVHSNGRPIQEETDRTKLDEATSIAIDGSGIDVVRVGNEAFAKVDAAGLGQKTGLFTVNQIKMFTADMPPQAAWINDVIDGKWIGLPPSAVDSLLKNQGATGVNDPEAMKKVRSSLQSSLEHNATVEKTGDKDGANEMTVKIKVKPLLADMGAALEDAGQTSAPKPEDLKNLRDDAVLEIKTLVKDDRVTHAEIDIPQMFGFVDESKLDPKAKKDLDAVKAAGFKGAVVMDFSTSPGQVTKPAGARKLTQADIDYVQKSLGDANVSGGGAASPAPVS